MIVAPHSLFREGLKAIIERDERAIVAGLAEDAEEAVDQARKTRPDIVLADVALRSGSGVELVEPLRRRHIRTVLLGPAGQPWLVEECIRAGASGFLPRDVPLERFLECIHAAASADFFLASPQGSGARRASVLTARETLVMLGIAQGRTIEQISEELRISAKTVVNHRARLMSKLQVETPVGIVRHAARLGLVDLRKGPGQREP